YYVVATQTGGCTTTTGTADVISSLPPIVYTLTATPICTPSITAGTLTLSNSQTGVSYQLKNINNGNVQIAQPGSDGTPLTWSGLNASNGGYHVVATNTTGCTSSTGNVLVVSS